MQDDLFGTDAALPQPSSAPPRKAKGVLPAPATETLRVLAQSLPLSLRMGVSTWSYPGWEGLVWDGAYDASVLSRTGLTALSQHPLMRTVCVDRSFWRPLSVEQYAKMAAQVPPDFRFVVKCPNVVTDAMVRSEEGKGQQRNRAFLNASLAVEQFVTPALQGLGDKLGVLVYQLSPLPWDLLCKSQQLFDQLGLVLAATRQALQHAPHVIVAVEVRDPLLLEDGFAQVLKAHNAAMCLGLHGKMPPIEQQLPILRKLWPSPFVCRWNLNHCFGPFGYADAQEKHQPFNELRTPDPHTRSVLASTIRGITQAGQTAFVTISNDAEGCAPQSIQSLAEQLQRLNS